MKRLRELDAYQKMILKSKGIDPSEWLLFKDYNKAMYLESRDGKQHKWVNKSPDRAGKQRSGQNKNSQCRYKGVGSRKSRYSSVCLQKTEADKNE